MQILPIFSWRAAAVAVAFGVLTGPVLAEQVTGSEIPKNSYYDDPLTQTERDAIASEENVSPNDGRPSTPDPADRGVIPTPADVIPGDRSDAGGDKPMVVAESEADKIIDDSKKSYPVTTGEMDKCMGDWDPQTQMSKEEWEQSCRSTLPYFPEGE
jgi:hypothetical protein